MIAVTGATGFLGSHLIEASLDAGLAVRGVVRTPSRGAWLESLGAPMVHGDLGDEASLRAAFAGAEVVVANAALAPGWARADDAAFLRTNIEGTRHTLRAAADAGVRRVVLISSVSVYRTSLRRALDEAAAQHDLERPRFDWNRLTTDPRYARSKLAGEQVARRIAAERGLELVILRPGPVYGPRDPKLTARYGRLVQRRVLPAPTVSLPHVHARDVADAAVSAARLPGADGRAFNLAGESVRLLDVLRWWRAALGTRIRLVPVPVPLSIRFDDGAARRVLGFRPRPTEEGMVQSAAWFAGHHAEADGPRAGTV